MAIERDRSSPPPERADPEPGPAYTEQQVTQILQRAAQLERGRPATREGLSLAEVEAIARDSGLDPSLVRIAARSLDEVGRERGLGARVAGAPVHRVFERVVEGEIDASHHERLLRVARSGIGPSLDRSSPHVATVGRTLMISSRTSRGLVELTIAPGEGKTHIRIDASAAPLAGGLFGGLVGGLGGGMTPVAVGLALQLHAGMPAAVAAGAGVIGAAFAIARTIFSALVRRQYKQLDALADDLERAVREGLGR